MKIRNFVIALAAAATMTVQAQTNKGPKWLEDAIFYQIYPSSFMDSNGDGIGDLPGITSKLDYVKSVGANAIWLNPVFESGWFDGGYDVIDFYKIDPRFGTNDDMVTLIAEAHKRGIKICLDLVAGHTSDKCEWFKQSMQNGSNNRYSDYYIWLDSISDKDKEDIIKRHQDPNPAASYRGRYVESHGPRAKYYLKNFFECQPALNFGYAHRDPNHPWEQAVDAPGPKAVRREMKNIMSFWFDKGIDGFRVDMAASLTKNDDDRTAIKALWREFRQWKDTNYPECVFISEWGNPPLAIPAGFNVDFLLHFNKPGIPSLFFEKGTPFEGNNNYRRSYFNRDGEGQIAEFIDSYTECFKRTKNIGYIALPTANHDFQRPNVGTRNTPEQLKVALTFYLTMPGIPFIYYGDEIGMKFIVNAPDKEGAKLRAGVRTPMQWTTDLRTAGFSTCEPSQLYMPIDNEGGRINVEAEEKYQNSILNYVRELVKLRRSSAALGNNGEWECLSQTSQPYPLVYKRTNGQETFVIVINPSAKKVECTIPSQAGKASVAAGIGKSQYKKGKTYDKLTVNGFTATVYKLN